MLDSFAIMAWIQDEPGAQTVEDLLVQARRKHLEIAPHLRPLVPAEILARLV
ncbi:MAG: hypothetical protein HY713_05420 [candidate division NC10 bacterium]|nr:hypothetical protein [candidate division NC10 bacterium]